MKTHIVYLVVFGLTGLPSVLSHFEALDALGHAIDNAQMMGPAYDPARDPDFRRAMGLSCGTAITGSAFVGEQGPNCSDR